MEWKTYFHAYVTALEFIKKILLKIKYMVVILFFFVI